MKLVEAPPLYKKYHIDRDYELLSVFEQLSKRFDIESFLYPGCYVHMTPSFFIQRGVYVDLELKAKKVFDDQATLEYIASRKIYPTACEVAFHHQSYNKKLPYQEASFDLLISQYAGLVSLATQKYLKVGGLILVNNSHADAGFVAINKHFELVMVIDEVKGKAVCSEKNLAQYFVPKKPTEITADYLIQRGKGVSYSKTAKNYLFRKIA